MRHLQNNKAVVIAMLAIVSTVSISLFSLSYFNCASSSCFFSAFGLLKPRVPTQHSNNSHNTQDSNLFAIGKQRKIPPFLDQQRNNFLNQTAFSSPSSSSSSSASSSSSSSSSHHHSSSSSILHSSPSLTEQVLTPRWKPNFTDGAVCVLFLFVYSDSLPHRFSHLPLSSCLLSFFLLTGEPGKMVFYADSITISGHPCIVTAYERNYPWRIEIFAHHQVSCCLLLLLTV
jgi:hypothetical protein